MIILVRLWRAKPYELLSQKPSYFRAKPANIKQITTLLDKLISPGQDSAAA